MPSLAEYRRSLSVEVGPYIGPESYEVRATSGSTTALLVCSQYPIRSGIPQQDKFIDQPLYRPNAVAPLDRYRYIKSYTPTTGTLEPDLVWTYPPIAPPGGSTYASLEAFTYGELEALLYEDLEDLGAAGVGERFEILGPFDVPTTHQLINDGLKQCWLVVEVVAIPTENTTRHDLTTVCPWVQDPTDVLQVGVLNATDDRNLSDPYANIVRGTIDRDGGALYFNTGNRTFLSSELLYLRCLKRAYDHCRPSGGQYGDQSGLALETDEAPVEREWLASSGAVIAWRRYGHLLEVAANQRLIRDQVAAAAWFTDECRKHFTAPLPAHTFKPQRRFGPPALAGSG